MNHNSATSLCRLLLEYHVYFVSVCEDCCMALLGLAWSVRVHRELFTLCVCSLTRHASICLAQSYIFGS